LEIPEEEKGRNGALRCCGVVFAVCGFSEPQRTIMYAILAKPNFKSMVDGNNAVFVERS
jgi:hypothetical protein